MLDTSNDVPREDPVVSAELDELLAGFPEEPVIQPIQSGRKWPASFQRKLDKFREAERARLSADPDAARAEETAEWYALAETRMRERDFVIDSRRRTEDRRSQPDSAETAALAEFDAWAQEDGGVDADMAATHHLDLPSSGTKTGADSTLVAPPTDVMPEGAHPSESSPAPSVAVEGPSDEKAASPEASGGPRVSAFVPPSSLSYHAFQARRDLQEFLNFMRHLSRRNMYLGWGPSNPGSYRDLGKKSKNAIDISSYSLKEVINKEEGKIRNFFPTYFPGAPNDTRTIKVPELTVPRLPSWKNLPASGRRLPALDELLFGLRVTSLAREAGDAALGDWHDGAVGHEVGLLEIKLTGDAAERFLSATETARLDSLSRGLLRSLETVSGGMTNMVATWTIGETEDKCAHVFIALQHRDRSIIDAAITLDRSTRYIQAIDRAGIPTHNGFASPSALQSLQEELQAKAAPLAQFLEPPDGVDDQEFTPERGFASLEEVKERKALIERRWHRRLREHGLPRWFTFDFVEQVREYLLRDPVLADARRKVNRRLSKKTRTQADYDARDYLNTLESQLTNIRFHHGSPAQFAALAAASGKMLGTFCSSVHKAGVAKELYEALRAMQ